MWNRKSYPIKPTPEQIKVAPTVCSSGSREFTTGIGVGQFAFNSEASSASNCEFAGTETLEPAMDKKEKPPLLFCKFIVRYPWHAFSLTLLGHLLMLGVSLVLVFMNFNVFPAEFRQIPFYLNGHHALGEYWGWSFRGSDWNQVYPRVTNNIPTWERGINTDPLQVLYFGSQSKDNVITKGRLEQIRDIEEWLYDYKSYQSICQLDKRNGSCVLPTSIIRYFDGSMVNISSKFYDPKFENINRVLWEAYTNPLTKNTLNGMLGSESIIEEHRVYADYLRTSFTIGSPIHGINVGETMFEDIEPALTVQKKSRAPDLNVSPISWKMFVTGAAVYGVHDILLVLGSVIFIFFFVWFQTGSLWLTSFAVFSIITSFLGTNLIYRYILDFRYFSYFHLIAMFIILGIGADDIFVFVNTWKLSALENHSSLEHRMSVVYRRASISMFVTSFTTMVAFFVTSISPLLAARSFGIFTGLLVIVNYVSVVVFYPCVVVLYHKYLEQKDVFGPIYKKVKSLCCSKCYKKEEEEEDKLNKKIIPVVAFFKGPYFNFVSHPIIRWLLLSIFIIIIVVFAWFTANLKPDSEQVMIFKESTVLGKGWKLTFGAFKPSTDTLLKNNIVWGVRPRNLTNCHFSEYNCRGTPSWDDGFEMNIPEVQIAMRDFCRKVKNGLSQQQMEDLHIRRDKNNETDVHCFMDDMGNFLESEAKILSNITKKTLDLSFPLTESKVRPFMEIFSVGSCICPLCFYDMTKLPPSFNRYFEVMMSYWLTHRYTLTETEDFKKYKGMLGEGPDGSNTRVIEILTNNSGCFGGNTIDLTGFPSKALPRYGTKLRYAAIPTNLDLQIVGLGYGEGLPIYYAWKDFLNHELQSMPYQLRRAMPANDGQWHWLFVQQVVVNSAILGVALGISLALPVLILATRNFIVGTLSTLIIAATCTCVIGVIPLCGWKLGLLVSVNLCLVVGLSVDYIVHMSEGYYMSRELHRADKVKDTLGKVGVSVLSGAITTLGASFFMFFGNTQFFLQFAVFMFSTIGFSTLFSLGLFPVLMVIIGPQGDTGSLSQAWNCIKRFTSGREKKDTKCDNCRGKGFGSTELSPGEINEEVGNLEASPEKNLNNYENPCFEPSPTGAAVIIGTGNDSVAFNHGSCSSLVILDVPILASTSASEKVAQNSHSELL